MSTDEIWNVDGVNTHVLWSSCNSSDWTRAFVVVPGNPGVASFYKTFCVSLAKRLEASVLVIGHAGHFSDSDSDRPFYGLCAQVDHKAAVLKYMQKKYGTRDFVLMCHSIGSWISLELQVKYPQIPIVFTCHLCPTFRHLWEGFSPLVRVATRPPVTWLVSNIVHYCPLFLRKWLIWAAGHADTEEILLVAEEHTDFYVSRNILQMANEEAVIVRDMKEEHLSLIKENVNKHFFVFSQIDHYVPMSYVEDLKKWVPQVRLQVADPEVEHAFVLRHSEWMAERLAWTLAEFAINK